MSLVGVSVRIRHFPIENLRRACGTVEVTITTLMLWVQNRVPITTFDVVGDDFEGCNLE